MTPTLFFERLRDYIKTLVWTGTTNKLFGDNVFVVPVLPAHMYYQIVAPSCYISPTEFQFHAEHPNIIFQAFEISIIVENVSSGFGEGVVLGANRTANTSRGAGMLDVMKELMINLNKKTDLTSKVYIVEQNGVRGQFVKGNIPHIYQNFVLSVLLNYF